LYLTDFNCVFKLGVFSTERIVYNALFYQIHQTIHHNFSQTKNLDRYTAELLGEPDANSPFAYNCWLSPAISWHNAIWPIRNHQLQISTPQAEPNSDPLYYMYFITTRPASKSAFVRYLSKLCLTYERMWFSASVSLHHVTLANQES